jgi:hypothetical protein
MPPRRSRSREREPQSGPSRQESRSNKLCPRSQNKGISGSSPPQTSGGSIPPPRPGALASSTNVESGARMIMKSGSPSKSANMPKTQPSQLVALASKEATSPASTPTSPGYFDLSQETADPASLSRPPDRQAELPSLTTAPPIVPALPSSVEPLKTQSTSAMTQQHRKSTKAVSTPQARQIAKKKKLLPMQQPQLGVDPSLEAMALTVRSWSLSRTLPDPPCLTCLPAPQVTSQVTWTTNPTHASGSKTQTALHPPLQEATTTAQVTSPTRSPRQARGLLPRSLVPCRRLIPEGPLTTGASRAGGQPDAQLMGGGGIQMEACTPSTSTTVPTTTPMTTTSSPPRRPVNVSLNGNPGSAGPRSSIAALSLPCAVATPLPPLPAQEPRNMASWRLHSAATPSSSAGPSTLPLATPLPPPFSLPTSSSNPPSSSNPRFRLNRAPFPKRPTHPSSPVPLLALLLRIPALTSCGRPASPPLRMRRVRHRLHFGSKTRRPFQEGYLLGMDWMHPGVTRVVHLPAVELRAVRQLRSPFRQTWPLDTCEVV